jgi:hypothetical protein
MDRSPKAEHLAFMRHSLALGESSIRSQKQTIAALIRSGRDPSKASKLLSRIKETHDKHRAYCDRLEGELQKAGPSVMTQPIASARPPTYPGRASAE